MCLIVFAYKSHPKYDLIFATNRDEFYKRPTQAARFWDDHPDVLAGKDLTAGGTWMGINRGGQFAALTNYRDPSITKEHPPSRGHIVLDYLSQTQNTDSYLETLHQRASSYMGFNILTGTPDALLHYSNQEQKINRVEPGVHGLSNHLLDTPWPKVKQAKSDLATVIKKDTLSDEEALFNILKNDHEASDAKLPQTGIPYDLEKRVSPIFIKSEDYGTRSSTILLIDKQGNVTFEERRFKDNTQQVDEANRFEFEIE